MNQAHRPTDEKELDEAIIKEWNNIPQHLCEKLSLLFLIVLLQLF